MALCIHVFTFSSCLWVGSGTQVNNSSSIVCTRDQRDTIGGTRASHW